MGRAACRLFCRAAQPTDGSNRRAQGNLSKAMLTRIVSMLTKLGRRNHELSEGTLSCGNYDYDNEDNNDTERHCSASI
jgi:hypothetical protein